MKQIMFSSQILPNFEYEYFRGRNNEYLKLLYRVFPLNYHMCEVSPITLFTNWTNKTIEDLKTPQQTEISNV